MLEDLKRLFRHGGIYLIGNILNRVGAFLLLPLYTQYLALAEYGVLEILYTTVAVVSVLCAAGLSHTTLRFYFDYKDEKDRHAVVTTNLIVILALGISGAILIHLASGPLSELLFNTSAYRHALDICLAIMVLEMSTEIGFAYLRAREKSLLFVWLSFARLLLQLGLSIYLVAVQDMGIHGVLLANLASAALGWLAVIGYTLAHCGLTFRRNMVPAMLRYSLPMAAGGLLGAISTNVDRFMMKEMLSLEAVGLYALAMKFALLLTFLVSEPFFRAYGPFRFSILDKPNAGELQALAVRYLVAAASFVALGIALFMPEVLFLMAGAAYQSAYLYVPVLLMAVVVGAASYCFETGILVKKKTKYLLHISLATLAAKIALNLALIPTLQVHGAALAYLGASLFQAALVNHFSQRLFPVSYPYAAMMRVVLIAAAVYLASMWIDYRNWFISIPAKLALVAVFVALLLAADNEIRQLLKRGIQRLRKRDA
ncbi:MAG: polysaccharide biosynthesis protein [Betaproteobacteria bacterium]|nr:polysaccharide biosynthesis protein [Betaproteobacteria bacterium]